MTRKGTMLNSGGNNQNCGGELNNDDIDESATLNDATEQEQVMRDSGCGPADEAEGSNGKKRKARGKGKGVGKRTNLKLEIHDGRIITPEAVREIGIIFHASIIGPWVTYSEYPQNELDELFSRFKESKFEYTCTEEELLAAFTLQIKTRFPDWMCELRKKVFSRYTSTGDRYTHNPKNIPPNVWRAMVDKWMDPTWKEKSGRNSENKRKSLEETAHHTVGSISMAKRRKEMLEETGIEPSPNECWKAFHAKKDGTWPSEKAKVIYETIENVKSTAATQDKEVDELQIYREATGEPSHGRVLGMGAGIKGNDFYGASKENKNGFIIRTNLQSEVKELRGKVNELTTENNGMKEELRELRLEKEKMKDELQEFRNMRDEVKELRELVKMFIPRSHLPNFLRAENAQSSQDIEDND